MTDGGPMDDDAFYNEAPAMDEVVVRLVLKRDVADKLDELSLAMDMTVTDAVALLITTTHATLETLKRASPDEIDARVDQWREEMQRFARSHCRR